MILKQEFIYFIKSDNHSAPQYRLWSNSQIIKICRFFFFFNSFNLFHFNFYVSFRVYCFKTWLCPIVRRRRRRNFFNSFKKFCCFSWSKIFKEISVGNNSEGYLKAKVQKIELGTIFCPNVYLRGKLTLT